LIGSTAGHPNLLSEELARAHCIARHDAAWANDYDNRHGSSVAARSQGLAHQHVERLAATLQKVEAKAGVRLFPELKPYYDAVQACRDEVQGLSAKSQQDTMDPFIAQLAKELSSGKLRTQTERTVEIPSRGR
jgi:hypothetical protein